MRFRDDSPAELARARTAVASWRDQNPAGHADELIAAIGHRFHRDYDTVITRYILRELLDKLDELVPRNDG